MDTVSLKTVLQVQRHGSIAGAARAMDMDPSSVSRIVATVEAGLGLRLFHRTTRPLSVTEEGQAYLRRVAPVLEELDAAAEAAKGARSLPTGLLRITASIAFSDKVLVPLLPVFQAQYPNITVDLHCSDTNLDLIEDGIDLAIRLAPAPQGDLVSSLLMPTHYKVVASPSFLDRSPPCSAPIDLTHLNCLRYALPGLRDTWLFRQAERDAFGVAVTGSPLIANAIALRSAALSGMGVALLADWLIDHDLAAGRLVENFPEYQSTLSEFETAAWLLYPNRAYLPRKVRVMIDFLKSHLGQATQAT